MKQDPRINAKVLTFRNYLAIFSSMLFFCGSYAGLYFLQIQLTDVTYIVLSMFTYVVVISAVTCLFFDIFRKKFLMRPVYRLCEAAKKVAQGDFSIRLNSMRRDGKKDEFVVLFEDFNTMVEELSSIEMLKNDFVSNVSHELKTPLAVIQNYATILQSEDLSSEEQKYYSRCISEASQRLSVLVTNILQVNRLDNQKIRPAIKPFNLSEALSRCILNYDSLLDEKNIDLDTELDQDLILESDENLLDMVWNNLISNAVKFTPAKGRIKVTARREDDWAVIEVADNGCGMEAEAMKHIFDKFYQADTSHATQGNGLGLSLVKRVIDLLEGEITVKSVLNEGTVFRVRMRTKQFPSGG